MDSMRRDSQARVEFEREVLAHQGELFGAALRMTGSRAEAQDLLQEAVLRAWTFWERFQPGTNGRAWMHRILVNSFISGYRRRRREREILGEIRSADARVHAPAPGVPGEGLGDEVAEALALLPEEFREVLVLVDLDERSYKDAARTLGCPIGTVMSRLHRARQAMKRQLSNYALTEGYVQAAA